MANAAARFALLGFFLTLLVGCDHVTKFVAKGELDGGQPRELIRGVLDLQYAENRDVAFSLLRWIPERIRAPLLIVTGALALFALAALLVRRHPELPLARTALILVTAGAFGNYIDRVLRGYVVDFIHIHHWPVFNVADIYVTVGAATLALSTVWAQPQGPIRRARPTHR